MTSSRFALAGLALLGAGWLVVAASCAPAARSGPPVAVQPTPAEQETMRRLTELEGSVLRLEEQVRRLNAELGARLEDIQAQVATINSRVSAQERLLSRAATAMSAFGRTAPGVGPAAATPEVGSSDGSVSVFGLPGADPLAVAAPPGSLPDAGLGTGPGPAQIADAPPPRPGEAGQVPPAAREPMDLEELRQAGEAGARIPEPPEEGQRLYETAYRDLQRENFQLALINFRDFLADYPQTRLSDNAQYWIGEAYYAQGQFNQAIEEFRKVIDEYPGQDKVPGAHYKIALCFINLRDNVTARRYLTYVTEHYPGTREARLAEEKLASL